MVKDPATGKVLVQNRVKNWRGYAFPGGHVEDGESFYDCAVRELREETGLTVRNLRYCGVVHWYNNINLDRYLVFLYKTDDFSGELTSNDEGENIWMSVDELHSAIADGQQENDFRFYMPLYFKEEYSELFISWRKGEPYKGEYR
jgi:8-oxo-dGTP diphosphatase